MTDNVPRVFHWGPQAFPTTLVAVTPSILARDVYLSVDTLPIRNKLEYKIKDTMKADFLLSLRYIPGNAQVGLLETVKKDIRANLETWIKTLTEDDDIYVTIPMAGSDKSIVDTSLLLTKNTSIIFKEKIYSSLMRVVVKDYNCSTSITASSIHSLFTNLSTFCETSKLVVNYKEVNPCSMCKLNTSRINNYCIYFSNDYECFFMNNTLAVDTADVQGEKLAAILTRISPENQNTIDKILDEYADSDDSVNNIDYIDEVVNSLWELQEEPPKYTEPMEVAE